MRCKILPLSMRGRRIVNCGKVVSVMSLVGIVAGAAYAVPRDSEVAGVHKNIRGYAISANSVSDRRVEESQTLNSFSPPLSDKPRISLGSVASPTSVGIPVAYTYDDWQYSAKGRHVDFRGTPGVHFAYGWMIPATGGWQRSYGYNAWNSVIGAWPHLQGVGCLLALLPPDTGLYPNLDILPSGKAVITGHDDVLGSIDNHTYYDIAPYACVFDPAGTVIPSSLYNQDFLNPTSQLIHPLVEIQEYLGETYTHVVGFESQYTNHSGMPQKVLRYFRKTGATASGTWDIAKTIDTVPYHSARLTASRVSPKVAIIYTKFKDPEAYTNLNPYDRDVWVTESGALGMPGFWTRHQITSYPRGVASEAAWHEVDGLYDRFGLLHVIWNTQPIPKNAYDPVPGWSSIFGRWSSRLWHWSDATNQISLIQDATYPLEIENDICGFGGTNMMTTGFFSISECNNRLYVAWSQSHDFSKANHPVVNDCASDAFDRTSAANLELWMSVSSDLSGLLWDAPRNLTKTYTLGCDSMGAGGICLSETKSSMSRYGMDVTAFGSPLLWPNQGELVDPTPAADPPYSGNNFLHIQYLEDYPGSAVLLGQYLQRRPIKWIRLACVSPVQNAMLRADPARFDTVVTRAYRYEYTTTPHGVELDTTLTIHNYGNLSLSITNIAVEQDNGPSGWLQHSIPATTIPQGPGGFITATIKINANNLVNSPPSVQTLVGRLIITSNSPTSPDTIPISCFVMNTQSARVWDTLLTGCTRLTISDNGGSGDEGIGKTNLDYMDFGECQPENNPPFNVKVYLYDGSPLIGHIESGIKYVNHTFFDDPWLTPSSLIPSAGLSTFPPSTEYEVIETGKIETADGTIGLVRTWIAPKSSDLCRTVILLTRVYSADGESHSGVRIGEMVDWDIPADTSTRNGCGTDPSRRLLYQFGAEYNQDPAECQESNARFGGVAVLGLMLNGMPVTFNGGAAAVELPLFASHPAFVLNSEQMYDQMGLTGFTAPSGYKDFAAVYTYAKDMALGPGDTLTCASALASVRNGSLADLQAAMDKASSWYQSHQITLPGQNVTKSYSSGIAVTFGDVQSAGITTVEPTPIGPQLPPGFTLQPYINSSFYQIATTIAYTGPVTVCFTYDPVGISGPETSLQLWHYNGSSWEVLPATIDIINHRICAQTTSLSPFALVTPNCCLGRTGNVDCDTGDGCDISDLSALIDFLYISFTPLCCVGEANVDGDVAGGVDISDLSALIDYLYISFTPPAVCR